ncbi:MAG: PKD domain-containing protein, partial [Methanocalculus sp. MSAO_Arc2]|uniref:PKD domain-containing protein n=1 Tax=Methanocalculus sp. MSAO_Arc2 TaxID=2293855 RepID=UPI000FF125DD
GTAPLTVQFTDESTGNPTSWTWEYSTGGGWIEFSTSKDPSHTFTSTGTYSIRLTATNDGGSNTITRSDYIIVTPYPPTEDCITLSPGWNFISVPRSLEDGSNTAAIFSNVNTQGRSILLYDSQIGKWQVLNQTSKIKPLDGIWIYSQNTISIDLHYKSGGAQVPPSKQLYEGWNAIGFSSTVPVTARDTLITVSPKWGQVLGWNAEEQKYDTAIIRGGSGAFSDTREMIPMRGYWIAMTEPGVLYALS